MSSAAAGRGFRCRWWPERRGGVEWAELEKGPAVVGGGGCMRMRENSKTSKKFTQVYI